jgi:hypothetical protein
VEARPLLSSLENEAVVVLGDEEIKPLPSTEMRMISFPPMAAIVDTMAPWQHD